MLLTNHKQEINKDKGPFNCFKSLVEVWVFVKKTFLNTDMFCWSFCNNGSIWSRVANCLDFLRIERFP